MPRSPQRDASIPLRHPGPPRLLISPPGLVLLASGTLLAALLGGCSACTGTESLAPPAPPDGSAASPDAATVDGAVITPDGSTCPMSMILCGGACVDPSTDSSHCGGCRNTCRRGETCVSGRCGCAGTTGCGTGVGNPDRCGGTSCDAREICISNACRCRPGLTRIGGSCVDLATDPTNCGAPGNRCPPGTACTGGGCSDGCPGRTTNCDGACVDLGRDPLNCGDCGQVCDRDQLCVDGRCRSYRAAPTCDACPCRACSGDFVQCCATDASGGLPVCVDADLCP